MSGYDIARLVILAWFVVWVVASVLFAVTRHRTKGAKTGYSERP